MRPTHLTISILVELDPREQLADYIVPALLDYCGAVVAGDAGLSPHEFYEAGNGIVLRVEREEGPHHAD